jgi:hypothetical protein
MEISSFGSWVFMVLFGVEEGLGVGCGVSDGVLLSIGGLLNGQGVRLDDAGSNHGQFFERPTHKKWSVELPGTALIAGM